MTKKELNVINSEERGKYLKDFFTQEVVQLIYSKDNIEQESFSIKDMLEIAIKSYALGKMRSTK